MTPTEPTIALGPVAGLVGRVGGAEPKHHAVA